MGAGCGQPISWWTVGANQSTGALPNPVVYWAGDVRVTVSNTGATAQPSNFIANDGSGQFAAPSSSGAYPGSLALKSGTSGVNEQNRTAQYVTFRFSQPVTNLTLTVFDIDRDHAPRTNPSAPGFMDQVFVADGSPRPTSTSLGSRLEGAGTAGSPWQAQAAYMANQPKDSHFDVTMTWAGPVSEVSIGYKQGVRQQNSFATVWISPIRFTGPHCT
ncbi:hypothetical protein MILU53160_04800 [Micrococcus luteus]